MEEGEGMTRIENSSGMIRSTDRDVQVRPRTAGAAAATAKNEAAVEVVSWSPWMKTTIRRRRSRRKKRREGGESGEAIQRKLPSEGREAQAESGTGPAGAKR